MAWVPHWTQPNWNASTPPAMGATPSGRQPRRLDNAGGGRHTPGVIPSRDGTLTLDRSRLNPKYTFDTFVAGSSNRFAHAAANAVSEAPAKAYNPLFIYGSSGLGKTHLLHAIGHYVRQIYPGVRVRYVNSEEFTNEFINSIRDDRTSTVPEPLPRCRRAAHRRHPVPRRQGADAGGVLPHLQRAAQQLQAGRHHLRRQPPKELSGFEERLRSRFEWGLITDVQAPDLETRIAILRKKTLQERMSAPDEVLEYIATR
jgi:chromosomal replication initiator protein